jgi:hypothetical protein
MIRTYHLQDDSLLAEMIVQDPLSDAARDRHTTVAPEVHLRNEPENSLLGARRRLPKENG